MDSLKICMQVNKNKYLNVILNNNFKGLIGVDYKIKKNIKYDQISHVIIISWWFYSMSSL